MDQIYINDLELECIIGTKPEERESKQKVILNLSLECDLSKAGQSDDLADTVNYKELVDNISSLVEESSFYLLEKMAEEIAANCLAVENIASVEVDICKPAALEQAESAGILIQRRHSNSE